MRFVVCLSREGFGEFSTDDLTLGRLYEVLAPADSHDMLRIIDDSGEDFLYPASLFEAVEVHEQTATRLHELLAAKRKGQENSPLSWFCAGGSGSDRSQAWRKNASLTPIFGTARSCTRFMQVPCG